MTTTLEPVPVPVEVLIFGSVLYGVLLIPIIVAGMICLSAAMKQQSSVNKQLKQKDGAT